MLIVDDTPDNLALLSDTLQAAGYAVLVALDGQSALQRLARITPDAVLLDAGRDDAPLLAVHRGADGRDALSADAVGGRADHPADHT